MAMLVNVEFCCPAECLEKLAYAWERGAPCHPYPSWYDTLKEGTGFRHTTREMRRWAARYREEVPIHPNAKPDWLCGFECWYTQFTMNPEYRVPERFGYSGLGLRLDPADRADGA